MSDFENVRGVVISADTMLATFLLERLNECGVLSVDIVGSPDDVPSVERRHDVALVDLHPRVAWPARLADELVARGVAIAFVAADRDLVPLQHLATAKILSKPFDLQTLRRTIAALAST